MVTTAAFYTTPPVKKRSRLKLSHLRQETVILCQRSADKYRLYQGHDLRGLLSQI